MADTLLLQRLDDTDVRLQEVSSLLADPAVIADRGRSVSLNREYAHLRRVSAAGKPYRRALADLEEAHELLSDGTTDDDTRHLAREMADEAENQLSAIEEKLRKLLVPRDPDDAKNAILEIRAGTGGDEAALFAGDLWKMYSRYCEAKGWTVAVSSFTEGAAGGFKEIVAAVSSPGPDDEEDTGVYGILKYESGVHRVQRVPQTETQGRVHTSAATVAVLPEAEAFDVNIDEGRIRWETFRSGGAGGQNVNKVSSGVRLRYPWLNPLTGVEEEVLIECTETRDQPKNKERALSRLRSMVYEAERLHRDGDTASRRKAQVGTGDRSAKIRTYNYPQGRVTDHRIGFTSHNLPGILAGDIDELIDHLSVAANAPDNQ